MDIEKNFTYHLPKGDQTSRLDKTIKDLEFLLKNNHGFLFGVREALELLKEQKEQIENTKE